MKWLFAMLLLCFATAGALVWRLRPPNAAITEAAEPQQEKKSRLAFEQPTPLLIPVADDSPPTEIASATVPPKPLDLSRHPMSTEVQWSAVARHPIVDAANSSAQQQAQAIQDATAAVQELSRKIAADPENLDLRYELGARQLSLRLWNLAIVEFEKVVAAWPEDFEAQFNLAIAYQGAARLADARRAWDRVLALDSANLEARTHRGETLLDLGEFDAAAIDFEELRATHPNDDGVQMNLAAALQGAKKTAAALAVVQSLLTDRPQHLPALKRAAVLSLAMADIDPDNESMHRSSATEYAKRAAAIAPHDATIAQLLMGISNSTPAGR